MRKGNCSLSSQIARHDMKLQTLQLIEKIDRPCSMQFRDFTDLDESEQKGYEYEIS